MRIRNFVDAGIGVLFFIPFLSVRAQEKWIRRVDEDIVAAPSFKQCHASTIVEVSPGKLLAAWFAGSYEGAGDVSIWLAENTGGRWGRPRIVATGVVSDSLRLPTWNPVLFRSREGALFLFYKVGKSPREWWGMVMRSRNGGRSWSAPERLPEGILGPVKNKPLQLPDGTILSGSSTETDTRWNIHIERSTDLGLHWERIPVDSGSSFDVIQPSILLHPDGRLQLLCRSKQGAVVQSWSADKGNTWSPLSRNTLRNPNAGTDAVTLQDGRQMIVYNPDLPGKEWFNGRSRLRVAVSSNGVDWQDIMSLKEGDTGEFSYPAIIQTQDGRIHITYTSDRKNIRHVVLEYAVE